MTEQAGDRRGNPNCCTLALAVLLLGGGLMACTPTVALQAPKEPITINLNIKIEQEVRIKVEKDLDQVFASKSSIF